MANPLRSLFQLDPSIHFLNHGSFGACPIPVFDTYQGWQRQLEYQPVQFLGKDIFGELKRARQSLGNYVNADPDDLVYIPNATHGINIIARSLALSPSDQIFTTDHEYGACDYTWEFICKKTGATYLHQPIPLPARSLDEITDQFWQGVTPSTKVIFLSHITSPTALRLPVEEICARARQMGILTVVDGAHAPGQVTLDLPAIGADFYVGNCHKWMMSPKGAGFLYAREEVQNLLEPLVVSWGYHSTPQLTSGSHFLDIFGWAGTQDPAAYLSVPAAIQFMQEHDWERVRADCHVLLCRALRRICDLVQMESLYPHDSGMYHQMGIAPLPPETDIATLQKRLYEEYQVEVPLIDWNGRKFVRISVQGYNSSEDISALVYGFDQLLPKCQDR